MKNKAGAATAQQRYSAVRKRQEEGKKGTVAYVGNANREPELCANGDRPNAWCGRKRKGARNVERR